MKKLKILLSSKSGSLVIDVPVFAYIALIVLCLALTTFPVFIAKQELDTYTTNLVRTAELSGRIGTETSEMTSKLSDRTGLSPDVNWSTSGKIQLGEEFTLTCTVDYDIGFGQFGSFPISLTSKQTGRSEVYWK